MNRNYLILAWIVFYLLDMKFIHHFIAVQSFFVLPCVLAFAACTLVSAIAGIMTGVDDNENDARDYRIDVISKKTRFYAILSAHPLFITGYAIARWLGKPISA